MRVLQSAWEAWGWTGPGSCVGSEGSRLGSLMTHANPKVLSRRAAGSSWRPCPTGLQSLLPTWILKRSVREGAAGS